MRVLGSLLLRPGTIFLFIMIGLLGLGMYSWANTSLGQTKQKSLQNQNDAIACSGLSIQKIKLNSNQTYAEVFFKVNRDAEKVHANFQGDENATRTLSSVETGSLEKMSANVSNFSKVSLKTETCEQVFVYE